MVALLTFQWSAGISGQAQPAAQHNSLVEVAEVRSVQANDLDKVLSFRADIMDVGNTRFLRETPLGLNVPDLKVLGGATALGLAGGAWILLLRRRVVRRTVELAAANAQLKLAEQKLLKMLTQERQLGELKSNFVSMVSHEFRTPLGIINSSAQILERYFNRLPAEDRVDHLKSITKSVRRMSGLMEEVLVLSKVEAGQMACKPADLDLASFCRRLTDELHSATHGQCPIQFEAGPLPPARADESLLRHILTNLLSNAVKFSPSGKPVHFHVASENGSALFTVRDEGLGIAASDRARLFKAFHRGQNASEVPGTGLGLTIVKRCVELHGGRIAFESREGEGTTFRVRVPVFGNSKS